MWEYIAIILGTIAFLAYLIKLYASKNADFWTKHGIRTLHNDLTFFQLITGKKNPIDFDKSYYNQLGDEKFGGVMELGSPVFFVKDLDLAKSILVKDFDYFIDRRDFGKDPVLKESLFFLQGQEWKHMRAFLSPTFTSGKIRRMFDNFEKCGQRWKEYIKSGFPKSSNGGGGHNVLVGEATKRFTVDVIGSAAFGIQTDALTNPDSMFYKMANKTGKMDLKRILRGVALSGFPRLASLFGIGFLDSDVNEFFTHILTQALRTRESSIESRGDFLQLLVEAKKGDLKTDESELNSFEKDAQVKLSDSVKKQKLQLTETMALAQGFLFFLAGFDTVSNFLNQAIYILAAEPEIQDKVYAELDSIIQSNGKITYDGINKMEYMDMFVSEVMRIYPAGQRLERKSVKDYPIPGTDKIVPKGVLTVIATEEIHRDEKIYPNPMKFDPERFNAENKAKRSPYAYQPFGIGPRSCIGMRFALIEVKVALAHLVYNFNIQPNEKTVLPMKVDKVMGTFRTPEDLEVRLVPRSE